MEPSADPISANLANLKEKLEQLIKNYHIVILMDDEKVDKSRDPHTMFSPQRWDEIKIPHPAPPHKNEFP